MPSLYACDVPDRSQDSAEAWDATYARLDALDEISDRTLRDLDDEQPLDGADWFDNLRDLPINPHIRNY